ncbi:MAG: zinc ribbon domain-containing protein [Methanobrevibacter sp.]|nr:zinc ribbon domain-containing protein [Methanobrevibacter sp.]
MVELKECGNCGTLNEQDSKFCEKCGNALNLEKTLEPKPNRINQIDCPFCGQKIPMNAGKCDHCGEWVDPSKDDSHNSMILLGYVISVLFGWFGLIPAIYLMTCDSPSANKNGKIQVVISLISGLIWMTL